jgi:predicted DNA-binding mobile mystery protein A
MSIKFIISSQYRDKVNQAVIQLQGITFPTEGWIITVRKALGMSAAGLARRLGKTRSLISNTEKAELTGSVTLKTMHALAEAMHCRFVYAIVPEESVEAIIQARAREKARQHVEKTSQHMALEQQSLSPQQIAFEIERLQQEMLRKVPADFWDDEV